MPPCPGLLFFRLKADEIARFGGFARRLEARRQGLLEPVAKAEAELKAPHGQ